MNNKSWMIFTLFIILVFCLRLPSFFQSVLSADESLYLLMAHSLVNGYPPYIQVWDNKPPGIYILFSIALILLGDSVLSIRIIACIAVAITCYLLYQLGNVFVRKGTGIGLLAGILYAVSSLTNGGLAANTEIFYTPFVVFAFLLLFSNKVYPNKIVGYGSLKFLGIGLLIGIGLQIKQVVIFDFFAILIIVLKKMYEKFTRQISTIVFLKKVVYCYFFLVIGLILPSIFVFLYFMYNGIFHEYFYANFTANIIRGSVTEFSPTLMVIAIIKQFIRYSLLYLCLLLTIYYILFSQGVNSEDKKNLNSILIWFLIIFPGIFYTKSFYSHYFLQLLPPLCLISSYTLINIVYLKIKNSNLINKLLILLTLIVSLFSTIFFVVRNAQIAGNYIYFRFGRGISNWGDKSATIAQYLQGKVDKNYIYVFDDEPIIYYLTNAKIPTKYIFPDFILVEEFSKVAGVDPIREFISILKKQPLYIIKRNQGSGFIANNPAYVGVDRYLKPYLKQDEKFKSSQQTTIRAELDRHLKKNYVLETSIEGVEVYKLSTKIKIK